MAYGVIRVENASGITLGKDLFSLKCESAIENGHVVVVGDYISGEVRAFSAPTAKTAMGNVAIIASVIILMILGVKYMLGSVEEKADYKKSFMPLIIGIILVVSATTIASFIFGMAK